jgi:iron complex transport system ATP-binding protein
VVSVLHEISVALLADDLVVMREGRVSSAGPANAPATHAALLDVFEHRLSLHRVQDRWVALAG